MRIQLLTHSFGPEITPPQRRWSAFIETFLGNGVNVDVIAPNRQKDRTWSPLSEATLDSVEGRFVLHSFSFRFRALRWYSKLVVHFLMILFIIPRALRAPKPDLVIATVPALPTLVAGYIVSKIRRVPFVVEMRDAWPELLEESGIIRWKAAERAAVRCIVHMQRSATKVIAVTPGHGKMLTTNGCNDVSIIPNGYRFKQLNRSKNREHQKQGRLRVLYLGNLGESQGLQKVLDVAAVSGDWMDLRIVGKGSALPALKARAEELGLSAVFNPPAKGEAVLEWYDWADTCIVSLREDWDSFSYTVPSKLFELAGYGCHITGLVTGEAKNLILDYELGYSYEGDVMSISKTWLEDASAIKEWQPNDIALKEFKDRFDLERLGNEYVTLLNSHYQEI